MTLFFLLCFAIAVIAIAFLIYGICAFSQMRKYYKSLNDFDYYEYDFSKDGDE